MRPESFERRNFSIAAQIDYSCKTRLNDYIVATGQRQSDAVFDLILRGLDMWEESPGVELSLNAKLAKLRHQQDERQQRRAFLNCDRIVTRL